MRIPTTLRHKPVIAAQDYDRVDGREAYDSEAKGLSIGLAQWNDRGSVDISAKIWRHTGGKWSRQSEEMPLHRVLDLAILIARTKRYYSEMERAEEVIDRIPLQGDAMTVSLCRDNPMFDTDERLLRDALGRDDEMISERLRTLRRILEELP